MRTVSSIKSMQGATLAIALIMLLLISIVGVTAMKTTIFEEKMSTNMQDKEMSFQSAESALVEGEAWILALTAEPIPVNSCATFPCVETLNTALYAAEQTATWWNSNSATFASGALANINSLPRYMIEYYRFVPDTPTIGKGVPTGTHYYSVTSRGTGASDDASSVLRTSVGRRY